jgi:hypothetical protein
MSIIQTTATTFPGARYPADYVGGHKRRPAVTPREVRPARWQLSGLLICGVLFSALGANLLALGMDANRSAASVACGLLMMVAAAVGLRQGRRTALTLDGRACQIATADGRVWIPWAEMAGTRVEHAWGGSHVVLEVDTYERTDAPLWEARRTLRRMLGATALVIAIAVALAPPTLSICDVAAA